MSLFAPDRPVLEGVVLLRVLFAVRDSLRVFGRGSEHVGTLA